MSDSDLTSRRLGQKADPIFGDIYTKEVYAPTKPAAKVLII